MDTKPNEKPKTSKKLILILVSIFVIVVIIVGLVAGFSAMRFKKNRQFGMRAPMNNSSMMRGRMPAQKSGRNNFETGTITAISGSDFTLKNDQGMEIKATVLDATSIYNSNGIASTADLKVGAKVTLTGRPNSSGVVQASEITIQ